MKTVDVINKKIVTVKQSSLQTRTADRSSRRPNVYAFVLEDGTELRPVVGETDFGFYKHGRKGQMSAIPKPVRELAPSYLRWCRLQECWAVAYVIEFNEDLGACAGPKEAHHVRKRGHGGLSTKTSDKRTAPTCRYHHELAQSQPNRFREFLESLISRLNHDFDLLFPAKEKRERKKSIRAKLHVTGCPCGAKTHLIRLWRERNSSITFQCPVKNVHVEVLRIAQ